MVTPNNPNVTFTLTLSQAKIMAALVDRETFTLTRHASGLHKALLYAEVQETTETDIDQTTRTKLAVIEQQLTIAFWCVIFSTHNSSEAELKALHQWLKTQFPHSLKYYAQTHEDPRLVNDRVFRVYVPVEQSRPDPVLLEKHMDEFRSVELKQVLSCWQGERETDMAREQWSRLLS